MSLNVTVTPFQLTDTEAVTNAKLNQGFNPTIGFTGSVGTTDIDTGAVTTTKVLPGAFFYGAATGTDTYAATLAPPVPALANGVQVWIKLANANLTTTPTLNVDGLGAKRIFFKGEGALRAGDIVANVVIGLIYNTSLNSGVGGWQMQETQEPYAAVAAAVRNLEATNSSASQITLTADESVLKASTLLHFLATTVNVNINIAAAVGAGALDVGVEAASTWYYIWLIYNPTTATVAGMLSLSSTAPTMPSGYTYKGLVGAVRNDAGSNFIGFHQRDRQVWQVTTNVFTAKAAAVNDTFEILAGADLTAFRAAVPPVATMCSGVVGTNNTANATSVALASVATDGTLTATIRGQKSFHATTYGASQDSFAACCSFENLAVRGGAAAYNIQWKSRLTTDPVRLNIDGWSF